MQTCARCGHRVVRACDKITITKIWHRCCFTCFNCRQPLTRHTAQVCSGEIFCECCLPQCGMLQRVISVPSCNGDADCFPRQIECGDSLSREVHSCSCIPNCCKKTDRSLPQCAIPARAPKSSCRPPKSSLPPPKCCKIPPKCCAAPPKYYTMPPKCCIAPPKYYSILPKCGSDAPCPPVRQQCHYCGAPDNCCDYWKIAMRVPRCVRCDDKVYAAEKIITSSGSYHNYCFSCYNCGKALGVKTMYEACGEIYCKQCYNNYFGLNCYGYY